MFYCLLWNKTKKKASHLVISSITRQTQPFPSEFDESPFARIRPLPILPRTTRKNSLARPEKVYTQWVGLDGIWILSCELLKVGCDWLFRPQITVKLLTIVYKGKPLPRSPFVCSCWVPIRVQSRKTRFCFINHGSRHSSLSEGGLFSVRYWLGLLFKQISSYSDQDKLKFVENVWKRLTRWAIWLPSVSGMFEFYPSFCVEQAVWEDFPG